MVILGLFFQTHPVFSIPVSFSGEAIGALVGGDFLFGSRGGSSGSGGGYGSSGSFNNYAPKDQTVVQAEFNSLNAMAENLALLNQTAGGSLDTFEILK